MSDTAQRGAQDLEARLDDFDPGVRSAALDTLEDGARPGAVPGGWVNLHAHTFFSYNPLGYSPSHYAWRARREGLAVAGIVDFDVLDGVGEFHRAGALLGLKTCASLESRVYVPEFADKVLNSPGEPGVSYHMGVGFVDADLDEESAVFLRAMRESAARRTRDLVGRINAFLAPLELDYERDVVPLTPRGNVTERHVCAAYVRKAAARFAEAADLRAYWTEKLGELPEGIDLPTGGDLQALVRSKTMKRGGIGYVQPDEGAFPLMADMDRFTLRAGAIPTLTWLDGTSDGEQEIERLVKVTRASGAAAINIIPDRNFTRGVKDEKLHNLYTVTDLAEREHLPVIVGTEMNSPGQRFVDDFESDELKPLVPLFIQGAYIVYAHSVLQRHAGMGYLSPWAQARFGEAGEKNVFFAEFGRRFEPGREEKLAGVDEDTGPESILDVVTD